MKLTPDFLERASQMYTWLVLKSQNGVDDKGLCGWGIGLSAGLLQPFMQIAWERYAKHYVYWYTSPYQLSAETQCIVVYLHISIKEKIEIISIEISIS